MMGDQSVNNNAGWSIPQAALPGGEVEASDTITEAPQNKIEDETSTELLNIDTRPNGTLIVRSQFEGYSLQGHELKDMSLLAFITDMYEMNTCQDRRRKGHTDNTSGMASKCGHPANFRSQYLDSHQSHDTKIRVICSSGHQTIVIIIGKWFPWGNDLDSTDSHHASMLCLLKPWRGLSMLKSQGETWTSAYENFLNLEGSHRHLAVVRLESPSQPALSGSPIETDPLPFGLSSSESSGFLDLETEQLGTLTAAIIGNAQFYYDCKDAATHQKANSVYSGSQLDVDHSDEEVEEVEGGGAEKGDSDWSKASLEKILRDRSRMCEVLHGEHTVKCMKSAHIFNSASTWQADVLPSSITCWDIEKLAS
ncbi:uncharacterized protein EI90DRAFT_3017161 [Cantharellus anzutake]|uniref:uncharacterized protein n=1 Tax=Cantharellus anzutake TaxID=1750568 RepID=UPI001908E412|nr:uncharacterized protein EI90DRAFT_3017161 [Cantharellus anzutake]KAF8329358.1 hypothetical protein EI90DRAFT_3017161 [Cantharellus anzutake]